MSCGLVNSRSQDDMGLGMKGSGIRLIHLRIITCMCHLYASEVVLTASIPPGCDRPRHWAPGYRFGLDHAYSTALYLAPIFRIPVLRAALPILTPALRAALPTHTLALHTALPVGESPPPSLQRASAKPHPSHTPTPVPTRAACHAASCKPPSPSLVVRGPNTPPTPQCHEEAVEDGHPVKWATRQVRARRVGGALQHWGLLGVRAARQGFLRGAVLGASGGSL